MRDVMVDLETLGNRPGCAILAIGAVAFDPATGALGREFYTVVGLGSCAALGLHTDPDTLNWWLKQSPEAREVLFAASGGKAPALPDALAAFDGYLATAIGRQAPRIWGNGADFDNPILEAAYFAAGMKAPWRYSDGRCYRTLKNLHPEIRLERGGTHHNALDDARTQAVHALAIFGVRAKAPGESA